MTAFCIFGEMTDSHEAIEHCSNCNYPLREGFRFCPNCGQKTADNLTFKVLFSNTIANYFSVDARFFKSFLPLMFRPGFLPRRFVSGKRQLYLHPAQFYLFISVIFFFLFSITIANEQQEELEKAISEGIESESNATIPDVELDSTQKAELKKSLKQLQQIPTLANNEDIKALDSLDLDSLNTRFTINGKDIGDNWTQRMDSLIAADAPMEEKLKMVGIDEKSSTVKRFFGKQVVKIYERRGGGIIKTFYDTIPLSMFFLLPIFAFLLKLFFFRRGNFAHHVVFSFYYFTFIFMVMTLLLLVNAFVEVPDSLDLLIVLSTYFYLLFAIYNFYKQSFIVSFIKTGFVAFFYLVFVTPISLILMALVAFATY